MNSFIFYNLLIPFTSFTSYFFAFTKYNILYKLFTFKNKMFDALDFDSIIFLLNNNVIVEVTININNIIGRYIET